MELKLVSTVIVAVLPITGTYAAALDRSGQSMSSFFQPNNYFEAGAVALNPTVKGKEGGKALSNRDISDMAEDYFFPNAALKLQLSDQFSFGLIYDKPFGTKIKYTGNNIFVSSSSDTILDKDSLNNIRTNTINEQFNALSPSEKVGAVLTAQGVDLSTIQGQVQYQATLLAYNNNINGTKDQIDAGIKDGIGKQVDAGIAQLNGTLGKGSTEVDVDSQNLSMVFGYQPTENLNLYAGGVYQTVKGTVRLRGQAHSFYNGYDADIKETKGIGWLAGIAYQIPEIALKASLTYRSEIDHDAQINEKLPTSDALALIPGGTEAASDIANHTNQKTRVTTPQSVNLDFQTGIMKDTIAFANLRWVNWKNIVITPYTFGRVSELVGGFNLVEYEKDQWSANVGLGHKFTDKWAGSVSVGWDSGVTPASVLGPTDGYWSVGTGAEYSPTPTTSISAGVSYFWLGDAKAQTADQFGSSDYLAEFKDNHALAYGLKIGYKF